MPIRRRDARARQRSYARRTGRATRRSRSTASLDWLRERPLTKVRAVIPSAIRAGARDLIRRPRWGNLRRLDPFSARYGYDRGTPIDRYYIEHFLAQHRDAIRGAVAEVKDSGYTDRFGGDAVETRVVVDVDATNPAATIVADLGRTGSLTAASLDCFVLTQTLQYVEEPAAALENIVRSLRSRGTLLLTVPAVARVDPDLGAADLWRFTPGGLARLLARACSGCVVEVTARGNLVTTLAFLHGLAAEELDPVELDRDDPSFPVVSCATVSRPA